MAKNKIVSLNISDLSYQESLDQIVLWAKEKQKAYVCFANVHMTIEAYDDSSFADKVNGANMVCADGMPLVKAVGMRYKKKIDRVAGMDMMPSLIEAAAREGLSVFFFGTTDEVLQKIEQKAKSDFPNLKIAGSFSPPFKKLSEEEKASHRELIIKSGAQLVFVALGCPKQEKWMAENSSYLNSVLLGVGGAFPVYVDIQKRAPEWIRSISMEWAYRFFQDPRRLFKRYFYTNSKFIYLFLAQLISRKS